LDTFDNSFDSTVSEIINKHAMELVEMRSGYEDLFYRRAVAILKVI